MDRPGAAAYALVAKIRVPKVLRRVNPQFHRAARESPKINLPTGAMRRLIPLPTFHG